MHPTRRAGVPDREPACVVMITFWPISTLTREPLVCCTIVCSHFYYQQIHNATLSTAQQHAPRVFRVSPLGIFAPQLGLHSTQPQHSTHSISGHTDCTKRRTDDPRNHMPPTRQVSNANTRTTQRQ